MFKVRLSNEASAEFREETLKYESTEEDLGREFIQEILRVREAIARMPRRFPFVKDLPKELDVHPGPLR